NAIPAFPFDGGYVFYGWVDAILEKTGKKDREAREKQAMEIARNISSLMIFLYVLVIIAALI
ncbi:MAG: metalloprotease, partial [archaeon]|nr:metalloprotease [archaeon]